MKNILQDFFETELMNEDMYQDLLAYLDSPHIRKGEYECNVYVLRKLDRSRVQIFRHLAPEDYAWGLAHGPVMSRREFREAMVSAGHARGYGVPAEAFADQACLDGDAFGGKSTENDKE